MYQPFISKLVITFFILSNFIIAGNAGKIFGKVTDEDAHGNVINNTHPPVA